MPEIHYKIDLSEALEVYMHCEEFRKKLRSGCFIYAEGSYVLATHECVAQLVQTDGTVTLELPSHIRKDISKYACAFNEITYHVFSDSLYRGDSVGSKSEKSKRKKSLNGELTDKNTEDIFKKMAAKRKEQFVKDSEKIKSCQERLWEIIQKKGENRDLFELRTKLSKKPYENAREYKSTTVVPDLHTIVSIAAGYNLSLSETEVLLNSAGHSFSPDIWEHQMYIFVLVSMCGYNLKAKNKILQEAGVKATALLGKRS